jgi:predicted KAP-like P-loop ATPase
MTVPGDNPIRRTEDDLLGRSRPAAALARQVLSLDASEGLVLGVLGPWGSGKTSFVNLARAQLEDESITVLDFNPWMFSGAEQLVESFFVELASQLRLKPGLAEIGKDLEDYGEAFSGLAWLPLIGPWVERGRTASKLFARILQRRKEGVGGRRQKLETALRALDKPLVVVLDDIDRLTTSEIRDIFKLIRLTANFPNVIYLAAFDRKRVEDALAEHGIPGRDYLEKILQVGVDLPAVPDSVLHRQVFNAIEGAIDGVEPEAPFSKMEWPDVYMEVVRPLLRNMRDVRRYAAAVRGTVIDLGGQIQLVDVLGLEAIRVFLPDVFNLTPHAVDGLTTTSGISYAGRGDPPHLKEQVEGLISAAGPHGDVVKAMIERLFPAAQRHVGRSHFGVDWKSRWLRERRVAHEDLLRLYLERVVGEGLQSFVDAESAWALMADRQALDDFLRSLDRDRLQDVVASLETYEDQFSEAHAIPSITVILNLLPDLPERQRGMLELDTRMVVLRVVYRLLKALPDEAAVESVVRQVLPEVSTLSAKLELISDVGHREGRGHKLLAEAVATQLEQSWRAEVRAATVAQLTFEPELLKTLYLTHREAEPGEDLLSIEADPRLTAAIVTSAQSETRSQAMGSRGVRRSSRLAWEVLVDIYGDQDTLKTRLDELRQSDVEVNADLMSLADKYLGGWRPDQFEE